MKKRAVAELTVMTSMRARVSMVRGCMLLAGHHPPHWCRCHHLTCDMSCVGPGPGTQGEHCCCLSIHCTSIMCHCVPDAAVLCHLTMHAGAKHLFIFNDFYKSKLPKTEGLKTIFHKIDCAQKKTPINRYFEFLIGRLDIVVRGFWNKLRNAGLFTVYRLWICVINAIFQAGEV